MIYFGNFVRVVFVPESFTIGGMQARQFPSQQVQDAVQAFGIDPAGGKD